MADDIDSVRINEPSAAGPVVKSRLRGINKNYSDVPSVLSHASKIAGGSNVIVETKQQDVSCFLWPIFA